MKTTAISVQGDSPIGACRRVASELGTMIEEKIDANQEMVDVRQGYFNGDDKIAQHFYVIVDSKAVEDISDSTDELIVDPTVRQFTKDNFYKGQSDTYVAKNASELPEVGLFTPEDEEYFWYE